MEKKLLTISGKRVDYENFSKDDVDVTDIVYALSMICRFNGHCKKFFSVAQHSLLVYQISKEQEEPPEVQLCALLHDAQEAYVGDLPTPLKVKLNIYKIIEQRIQKEILKKFGIEGVYKKNSRILKTYDEFVTNIEKVILLEGQEKIQDKYVRMFAKICDKSSELIKVQFMKEINILHTVIEEKKNDKEKNT